MANPIYKQIFQIHLKLQQLPRFKSRLLQVKKKKKKRQVSAHSKFPSFSTLQHFLKVRAWSYNIEENSYMLIKPISSSGYPTSP